jgi:hypothetical protein
MTIQAFWDMAHCRLVNRVQLLGLLDPEYGTSIFFQNMRNYLPFDTSHPERHEFSSDCNKHSHLDLKEQLTYSEGSSSFMPVGG